MKEKQTFLEKLKKEEVGLKRIYLTAEYNSSQFIYAHIKLRETQEAIRYYFRINNKQQCK